MRQTRKTAGVVIRGVIFGGAKRLDITADTDRVQKADAVFVDPFYLPARPYEKVDEQRENLRVRAIVQENF